MARYDVVPASAPNIDNYTVRQVDHESFAALLTPVTLTALRKIVQTGRIGGELRKSYFAGFRVEKLSREQIIASFERAIRSMKGIEPSRSLLIALVGSVPQLKTISREMLGRDQPFDGPVPPQFYDRLEMVLPERSLSILTTLVPPTVDSAPLPRSDTSPDEADGRTVPETKGEQATNTATGPEPTANALLPQTAADKAGLKHSPLEQASRLFKTVPPMFQSVVERDHWLWRNLEVPLLEQEDIDSRLLKMPGLENPDPPSEEEAIEYACATARTLETSRRYLESRAYWQAAAILLAQAGQCTTERFGQVTTSIARTAARGSGTTGDDEGGDLAAIVDHGVRSASTPVRDSVIRSLTTVGALNDSFYEAAGLQSQTRGLIGQALPEVFNQARRKLEALKGSSERFHHAVRQYTRVLAELQRLVGTVVTNPTIETVKGQRSKLLQTLASFEDFADIEERSVIGAVRQLLSQLFSDYIRSADEVQDEDFAALIQGARTVTEKGREIGSITCACLLVPLAMAVGSAATSHYQGLVRSKAPSLKVRLSKPVVATTNEVSSIDIEVSNDGSGVADECVLELEPSSNSPFVLDCSNLQFGRIAPDQCSTKSCQLRWPTDMEVVSLRFRLSFRDRSGSHQMGDTLKATRQQKIDWDAIDKMACPYVIRSIDEPSRLKGRSEQLRTLRMGFQSQNSFMITGQKRVGKTSLAKVLLADLRSLPDTLPLYMAIGELSIASQGDDLGRLGKDLVDRIVEEYEDRFSEPIGIAVPDIEEFRPDSFNTTFVKFIRQYQRVHKHRLAFVLDDFDELPTALFTGETGKAFFLALRALIDKGTSFFFVGSERLPAIIQEQAERLNQVRSLPLDYLDHDALAALVREPTKTWLEWTDGAIKEMEAWSARNPYFATLICTKVWDQVLRNRDCWVTRHDVKRAVEELAEHSDRGSYQHFWSDSPLSREEERDLYETKSSFVLLALSRLQEQPLVYVSRLALTRTCEDLRPDEVSEHLGSLVHRGVLETDPAHDDLVRFRVPLFALWLKHGGTTAVPNAQGSSSGRYTAPSANRLELSAEEVVAVVANLEYRDRRITTDEVRVWLAQFGDLQDQRLMLKLLRGVKNHLFTLDRFLTTLESLHRLARSSATNQGFPTELDNRRWVRNWFVTHADSNGKSGSATVKHYRSVNKISEQWCGSPEKVIGVMHGLNLDKAVIVSVDDFVGTGCSAVDGLRRNVLPVLDAQFPLWRGKALLIYAVVVGYEAGLGYIEEQMGSDVTVVCTRRLTESDKAFAPNSALFASTDERLRAKRIAETVGVALEKKQPLGYEDSQSLVVLHDNVPNNTLPILYKDKEGSVYRGKPWKALFPRS